jgi:hypothetical protein
VRNLAGRRASRLANPSRPLAIKQAAIKQAAIKQAAIKQAAKKLPEVMPRAVML